MPPKKKHLTSGASGAAAPPPSAKKSVAKRKRRKTVVKGNKSDKISARRTDDEDTEFDDDSSAGVSSKSLAGKKANKRAPSAKPDNSKSNTSTPSNAAPKRISDSASLSNLSTTRSGNFHSRRQLTQKRGGTSSAGATAEGGKRRANKQTVGRSSVNSDFDTESDDFDSDFDGITSNPKPTGGKKSNIKKAAGSKKSNTTKEHNSEDDDFKDLTAERKLMINKQKQKEAEERKRREFGITGAGQKRRIIRKPAPKKDPSPEKDVELIPDIEDDLFDFFNNDSEHGATAAVSSPQLPNKKEDDDFADLLSKDDIDNMLQVLLGGSDDDDGEEQGEEDTDKPPSVGLQGSESEASDDVFAGLVTDEQKVQPKEKEIVNKERKKVPSPPKDNTNSKKSEPNDWPTNEPTSSSTSPGSVGSSRPADSSASSAMPSSTGLASPSTFSLLPTPSPPSTATEDDPGDAVCPQCKEPVKNHHWGLEYDCYPMIGWMHKSCFPTWRRAQCLNPERCHYCGGALGHQALRLNKNNSSEPIKIHPECLKGYQSKVPFVKPTKKGMIEKYTISGGARRRFLPSWLQRGALKPKRIESNKNFQSRYFMLSPETGGISYYSTERSSKKTNKKAKRTIQIDPNTRMCSAPSPTVHPACTGASPPTEIVLVFKDRNIKKAEEAKLLLRFKSSEDQTEWVKALTKYVKIIDFPEDYMNAADKAEADALEKQRWEHLRLAKQYTFFVGETLDPSVVSGNAGSHHNNMSSAALPHQHSSSGQKHSEMVSTTTAF